MLEHVLGLAVERVALGEDLFAYEVRDKDALLERAMRDPSVSPYGGVLWSSSARAARALLDDERVRGQPEMPIVDVACGIGAIALCASRAGRRSVALDKDATARALTCAAALDLDLDIEVGAVDLFEEPPSRRDCIWVFADVLYEPELAEATARFTNALTRAGERTVVIDPGRTARARFVAIAGRGLCRGPRRAGDRLELSRMGLSSARRDEVDERPPPGVLRLLLVAVVSVAIGSVVVGILSFAFGGRESRSRGLVDLRRAGGARRDRARADRCGRSRLSRGGDRERPRTRPRGRRRRAQR